MYDPKKVPLWVQFVPVLIAVAAFVALHLLPLTASVPPLDAYHEELGSLSAEFALQVDALWQEQRAAEARKDSSLVLQIQQRRDTLASQYRQRLQQLRASSKGDRP